MIMPKRRFIEIIEKIATSPIFISFFVFLLATFVVYRITIRKVESAYDKQFIKDVLIEAHGMLFDILIIGTLIFALHKLVEKRLEKKRAIKKWKEEIIDFRGWESEEATHKIVGNIRRLNRNGVTRIIMDNCYLKNARLEYAELQEAFINRTNFQQAKLFGAKFQKAYLWRANLQKTNLITADLSEANLNEADLQEAKLNSANLQGARLNEANLKGATFFNSILQGADLLGAKNLSIEQIFEVKTLYMAKLDPPLMEQIKEQYPNLLRELSEVDESNHL